MGNGNTHRGRIIVSTFFRNPVPGSKKTTQRHSAPLLYFTNNELRLKSLSLVTLKNIDIRI